MNMYGEQSCLSRRLWFASRAWERTTNIFLPRQRALVYDVAHNLLTTQKLEKNAKSNVSKASWH